MNLTQNVEPINIANLRVNQWSQINDTVEPSLATQDINPIAYMPDLTLHPTLAQIRTRAGTAD